MIVSATPTPQCLILARAPERDAPLYSAIREGRYSADGRRTGPCDRRSGRVVFEEGAGTVRCHQVAARIVSRRVAERRGRASKEYPAATVIVGNAACDIPLATLVTSKHPGTIHGNSIIAVA